MNSFPEWFKVIMRLVVGFMGLGLALLIVGGLSLFLFAWIPAKLGFHATASLLVLAALSPVAYCIGYEWIG
jgi:hypothetical protein